MTKWMPCAVFGLTLATAAAATAKHPAANAGHGNMIHCPSSVNGAKTEIADIKDGVEVTVTGATEAAQKEIRLRAQHLVESSKQDPTSVRHTGDGHGGGGVGKCPVVLKDTLITSEDVKGGAKLTVRPVKPVDIDWLRKESRDRLEDSNTPAKK